MVPAASLRVPYAMAPEQVRGEVADGRTDVWALGVLLYELATGARPFSGASVPELLSSILTKPPSPPSRVPVQLTAVITRCLEKDPARRYQRADEVRAALEAIAAGTAAPWSTWGYRLRRRPTIAAIAAAGTAFAVLLGLNLGGLRDGLISLLGEEPPIKLAVLPFENLTGDPGQEFLSDGLTDEMIAQLGRLHPQRLHVIARTSSMRYKRRDLPMDQVARELGVGYLMEGTVRREANRVRISARLIQARDQTQRWSETFEQEMANVLAQAMWPGWRARWPHLLP